MSSQHQRAERKGTATSGRRALLAMVAFILVMLIGWWLYPAQETVARAREQTASRRGVALPPASSSGPVETEAEPRTVPVAGDFDRAALLRAIVRQRALAQVDLAASPRATVPTLGREYVASGIRSAIPLLTECYDALREKRPEAAGTVRISATIDAEPEVGAVVTESEVSGEDELASDAEFTRCLRETMRTIELEPPDRAGRATFSFPLRFAAYPSPDAASP